MATLAPSDARRLAMAAPMPRLAPVTMATFPLSLWGMMFLSFRTALFDGLNSVLAITALHVLLANGDLGAALFRRDQPGFRGQVLQHLGQLHFLGRGPGQVLLG